MNVSSVSNNAISVPTASYSDTSVSQDYADFIKQFYNVEAYQSRDEVNASDGALQQFKDNLSTKGAVQFLADLNKEKIDALVEEYRQKLLEEQKKNPDQPMDIDQMVSAFRKQLLEEMMQAGQKDDNNNPFDPSALLTSQDILAQNQALKSKTQVSGTSDLGFLSQILTSAEPVPSSREESFS